MSKSDLGEPFYEQENKDGPTTSEKAQTTQEDSAVATMLQKHKSRIPVKKSKTNPWSVKIPKSGTGVCTCGGFSKTMSHAHDATVFDSKNCHKKCSDVATDLMQEENRESLGHEEDNEETLTEDRFMSTLKSKSMRSKPNASNQTNCGTKSKQHSNVIYYKSSGTLKSHPRDRSYSMGAAKEQCKAKTDQPQSYSMEDISVPTYHLHRKPSASFEEAMERGYNSDTRVCVPHNNVFKEDSKAVTEKKNTNNSSKFGNLDLPQNGFRKQSMFDSPLSDDVFMKENFIDDIFQRNQQKSNICAQSLPSFSTFKPEIPSEIKNLKTSRSHTQKITMVSFDSNSRRSSIELTKDDLYVSKLGEDNGIEPCHSSETSEIFPFDVFTEVSASTLAALKRHGSSLNVAPSSNDNSPREPQSSCKFKSLPLIILLFNCLSHSHYFK